MKNPVAYYPYMEYRISIHISSSSSYLHQKDDYQTLIELVNRYFSTHFLVLSYVLLPNQCHFLVRSRSLYANESIQEYSQELRASINSTFRKWRPENERNGMFVLPIPMEGVERINIIKQSILHFHSLPVHLGIVEHEGDWFYSSYQWLKKGSQIHPLSNWLVNFLSEREVSN